MFGQKIFYAYQIITKAKPRIIRRIHRKTRPNGRLEDDEAIFLVTDRAGAPGIFCLPIGPTYLSSSTMRKNIQED